MLGNPVSQIEQGQNIIQGIPNCAAAMHPTANQEIFRATDDSCHRKPGNGTSLQPAIGFLRQLSCPRSGSRAGAACQTLSLKQVATHPIGSVRPFVSIPPRGVIFGRATQRSGSCAMADRFSSECLSPKAQTSASNSDSSPFRTFHSLPVRGQRRTATLRRGGLPCTLSA